MNIKTIFAICALAFILTFTACVPASNGNDAPDGDQPTAEATEAADIDAQPEQPAASPTASPQPDTPVGSVDGQPITFAEFNEFFIQLSRVNGYTDEMLNDELFADSLQAFKENVLDTMIFDRIIEIKAKEFNITLSDEKTAEINEKLETNINAVRDNIRESLTADSPELEGAELDTAVEAGLNEYLSSYGLTQDMLLLEEQRVAVMELVMEHTLSDISVDDAEIDEKYTELVEQDKFTFSEDPSQFELAKINGDTIYYTPGGVRLFDHILVAVSDDEMNEISQLRSLGDDEGADAALDTALQKIKTRADELYNRVISGEDFDEIKASDSDDAGKDIMLEPFAVVENSSSFIDNLPQAVYEIPEINGISQPVGTDYGYHILKLIDITQEAQTPFDTVKAELSEALLNEKKDSHWTQLYEQWRQELNAESYTDIL